MYRALLFDLNGTLADTDALHLPIWADVLEPYGIEVDEELYRERISGRINPEIVADLLPDLPPHEAQKLAETKEASFRKRAGELEPLAGLLDFVDTARSRGKMLALVTNAPEENVRAILEALNLEDVFDPVGRARRQGRGQQTGSRPLQNRPEKPRGPARRSRRF